MDEVFSACMGHWLSIHPPPDSAPWLAIEDFEERARRVLGDVYRWYGEVGYELYPVYRDIEAVPASSRLVIENWTDPFAEVIVGQHLPAARAGSRLRAIAMHLVRLMTWRSLVVDGGLSADEAASLGIRWLMDVYREASIRSDSGSVFPSVQSFRTRDAKKEKSARGVP